MLFRKFDLDMITETVVSFEVAKLLKEKGFDECPLFHYLDTGQLWIPGGYDKTKKWHFPAPTLQMAMKWLRDVHNLYIEARITNHSMSSLLEIIKYYWIVFNSTNAKWINESSVYTSYFNTYEDACESAIKYCLEKLI